MASRGIIVTYETIRQWTMFGQCYANELRRRQPQRGDKWHLDEVVLTINPDFPLEQRQVCLCRTDWLDATTTQAASC
ncbi:hypothetical protein [Undibacterium sp. RTI2.2]